MRTYYIIQSITQCVIESSPAQIWRWNGFKQIDILISYFLFVTEIKRYIKMCQLMEINFTQLF